MIYEYALEPEMVAAWSNLHSQPHFKRAFGLGQGRIVSRYPKSWAKMVWDSFSGDSDMDKKRLEELLARLKETMVKRKDYCWDSDKGSWLENAVQEHARHPFFAIMARSNPKDNGVILIEADLTGTGVAKWDVPRSCVIPRNAVDMATSIEKMLSCCRWVKFIDPYILLNEEYLPSLKAFFEILRNDRPVGPPEQIEIHTTDTDKKGAATAFLKRRLEALIPTGLSVTLFRWKEKPDGQRLHNRYILTDIGGVSFHHGLDTGARGETDDIDLLDRNSYEFRCSQYNREASAFNLIENPLQITGA